MYIAIQGTPLMTEGRKAKSKIRIYADDTLLYNKIHNINDCLQLQSDISCNISYRKVGKNLADGFQSI